MPNEIEVSKSFRDESPESVHLKLERLVSAVSDEAALKAVERFLRSRGMKTEIFDPDTFSKFSEIDTELAKEILQQDLTNKNRHVDIEIKSKEKEIEISEKAANARLDIENIRATIMADKKILVASLVTPIFLYVILTLFGYPISAAFLLIMCFGLLSAFFFVRSDGLENLISKFNFMNRE